MAAGDDEGTLHILDIPRNLSKPQKNEVSLFFQPFLESSRSSPIRPRGSKIAILHIPKTTACSRQGAFRSCSIRDISRGISNLFLFYIESKER